MDCVYENHQSLYLLDGNIVLFAPRAPNTYMVFRVHQSMLSRISPVFESMFALCSHKAEEKYDGVPLIHMPDRADEVEKLLSIVYHDT